MNSPARLLGKAPAERDTGRRPELWSPNQALRYTYRVTEKTQNYQNECELKPERILSPGSRLHNAPEQ